ncbi:hypothetical protein [Phenylobacterium sp.]|uniref:hypothetical protein n=1 Tax=Phenylobacterium sp. TaxID=1871053 RepID=UPI0025CC98B0|nr:hypothetical protein [Phenylobacterium sp.]
MTQVDFEQPSQEVPAPKPSGSGRIVAAGVVGALALGAGLGLWARPASPPEPVAGPVAPEAPRPALQIVVDDGPAPIGPLLEVLPGEPPAPAAEPARPDPPELQAPRRTAGLMKVDAVVAAEPLLAPAVKIEPKLQKAASAPTEAPIHKAAPPVPLLPPKADKLAAANARAQADAAKVERAKVEKAKAEKARIEQAKAEKTRTEQARVQRARAEKAKAEKDARLAKAERARSEKAGKLAKADKAKAAKAKATKLAKADPRKPTPESRRLTTLVKAVKTAPARLKAEVAKKKVEVAQARTPPKAQKASVRPAPAKAAAPKPPARRPTPVGKGPVGEGPMRVARNDACAAGDPGEAAVCADRRLGVRDRQLQQAYRNAEAAGVPASALRRQQARWLQARAAAAREAPWAVEDVYEARIAELNDLTRDAREN